jgi:SSS family solute:Na+ symporter
MHPLWWLNPLVIVIYMTALIATGLHFSRRQTTTEAYFVASRSVPGWAMGISLLATIITSVTFIAYPGASYASNWSLIVPGVMMLLVPVIAGLVIVPFFRQVVHMTAFEYFGQRFGTGVRLYSSAMFALGHLSKMAFVLYLLTLTVNSMTGWNIEFILVITTAVTVLYALIGGLEAVIWADVFQGVLLWVGVLLAAGFLIYLTPLPLPDILSVAWHAQKFSLGSWSLDPHKPTVMVLLLYGLFFYLQKYTADQTVIQRYLAARNDRQALRGILLGAVLCLPVWALFMLVGTLLWAFYHTGSERLPAFITKGDQVFPYFLSTHLPPGVGGIFLAALFGAGMAMLASDLNCLATIGVEDFYRHWHPSSTDKERLRLGRLYVLASGAVALAIAWLLAHTHEMALALYYAASSIVAGGLAGIFLLSFLSTRATATGVQIGIVLNLLFTIWATLTSGVHPLLSSLPIHFTWHEYMIGVIGQIIVFFAGYIASWLTPKPAPHTPIMTLWTWLQYRRQGHPEPVGSIPLHLIPHPEK